MRESPINSASSKYEASAGAREGVGAGVRSLPGVLLSEGSADAVSCGSAGSVMCGSCVCGARVQDSSAASPSVRAFLSVADFITNGPGPLITSALSKRKNYFLINRI